jgi:hypothetical protein
MKYLALLLLPLFLACSIDNDIKPANGLQSEGLEFRDPPCVIDKYLLSHTDAAIGIVSFEKSSNLWTWASAGNIGVLSYGGVSSTVYGWPDVYNITVFQNIVQNNQLLYTESCDGVNWNPYYTAPIPGTSSLHLPTTENIDGQVHVMYNYTQPSLACDHRVYSTEKLSAGGWTTPHALLDYQNNPIKSCISPSLEYHVNQGVHYLAVGTLFETVVPVIYWQGYAGTPYYLLPYSAAISLDQTNPDNSPVPIAVDPTGERSKLYLFYTTPGTAEIQYKICGIGGNYGSVTQTPWSNAYSITGTSTNRKVSGFYDIAAQRLVVVYTNTTNNTVNIVYSDNQGASWTHITNVAVSNRAPSITLNG